MDGQQLNTKDFTLKQIFQSVLLIYDIYIGFILYRNKSFNMHTKLTEINLLGFRTGPARLRLGRGCNDNQSFIQGLATACILGAFHKYFSYIGGTVDITVEKVEGNGTLSEIHHPNGGPWGGTRVDNAFKEFLIDIFGQDAIKKFSKDYKSDILYLYRNFETLKRKTDRATIQKRILRIPSGLITCATDASALRTKIENSPFHGKVELKPTKDKLSIDGDVLQDMFNFSSTNIVQHVRQLFTDDKIQGINTIILVGGFAESALITNDIRAAFPDKTIIVPQECSLAVLKGAVLYGHNPKSITSRKMPYTFGISTAVPFDNRCHPPHKKTIDCNGVEKCEDVFKVFFEIDKTVIPNETTAVHSFNCSNYSSTANVEIYRTKDKHPIFVSDRGMFCTFVSLF